MSCALQISPKVVVYNVKAISPRTDPCGTFWERDLVSERAPSMARSPMATHCDLPIKYDLNHSRAVSPMPNLSQSRVIRVSWLTVSKAADRSSRTKRTTSWLSMALRMSGFTLKRVGSMLW